MPIPIIEVDARSREVVEFARRFPERFSRALLPAVTDAVEHLKGVVTAEQFGGDPLNTVTGNLRKSVASRVRRVGDTIVAEIGVLTGPATRYARIQEEGGTIRAKAGKALAIPLDAARTRGRVPKYRGPKDPRVEKDYPGGTFMLKRPGRAPLIMGLKYVAGGGKRRSRPVPLFALVKSVILPATRWLSEGVLKGLDVWELAFARRMERELFGDVA
jgi:hypothetical protein